MPDWMADWMADWMGLDGEDGMGLERRIGWAEGKHERHGRRKPKTRESILVLQASELNAS